MAYHVKLYFPLGMAVSQNKYLHISFSLVHHRIPSSQDLVFFSSESLNTNKNVVLIVLLLFRAQGDPALSGIQ